MRAIAFTSLLLAGLVAIPPLCIAQETTNAPAQSQPKVAQPPRPAPGGGRGRSANLPVPESIQFTSNIVYAQAQSDDGKPIDLKMDAAFLKQSDDKPMPVIVYIHGGAWREGSKEAGRPWTIGFAMGGYFAVSIDYRLSGVAKYPAAVYDCKAAIRFLRANANELGIDPDRIGVWGHSAGGHLAALLGTSGNSDVLEGSIGKTGVSSAVQCVVDVSGPIDLSHDAGGVIAQWLGGPVTDHLDLAKQASPLTYIDKNDPPVLIIHGTADQLVDIHHAEMFDKALKDAGVPVEYMAVEGAGHGVADPAAYVRTAEFFDAHLGGGAAAVLKDFFERMNQQRSAGEGAAPAPGGRPRAPAAESQPATTMPGR